MLERGSGMSGESPRAGGVAHSASRFSPVTRAQRVPRPNLASRGVTVPNRANVDGIPWVARINGNLESVSYVLSVGCMASTPPASTKSNT